MEDGSKTKMIQVMVVDDHFIVRMGLINSINLEADMVVQCDAADGAQAIALYRQHRPDIVLMDLSMPCLGGVEATKAIRKEYPSAAVIMFSMYDREEDIYRSLKAGAATYLLKTAARAELIETIRAVHARQCRISPMISACLAERRRRPHLTACELDILRLMSKARRNKEIAEELAISDVTVHEHVDHIFSKLGTRNRIEAVMTALQWGIIDKHDHPAEELAIRGRTRSHAPANRWESRLANRPRAIRTNNAAILILSG